MSGPDGWNVYKGSMSLMRQVLVAALGGKCSCDGSDCWHVGLCRIEDSRCLQLDHVRGDGARDRERLGQSSQIVRYYLDHLDEARENLQVLCANCNWVKRTRNGGVRNGVGRSVTEWQGVTDERLLLRSMSGRLASVPRFLELVDKVHGFQEFLISHTAETDVVDWMSRVGLDESSRVPLSVSLARRWRKLGTYGDTPEELNRFVKDRIASLDVMIAVHGPSDGGVGA